MAERLWKVDQELEVLVERATFWSAGPPESKREVLMFRAPGRVEWSDGSVAVEGPAFRIKVRTWSAATSWKWATTTTDWLVGHLAGTVARARFRSACEEEWE